MATAKKAAAKKTASASDLAKPATKSAPKGHTGHAPGEVHELEPRDPNGVYLDDVNAVRAEYRRAELEGREPDFSDHNDAAVNHVAPGTV